MPLQPARLDLAADGTPYCAAYGDVYHSAHGGPAQARHVFLGGNDLPGRWCRRDRFVILETGFGLGLNFLATWQAWRDDHERCRRLHFVSCEKHPLTVADLAAAHRAWPEFAALAEQLQSRWPPLTPGIHRLHLDGHGVTLTLAFGDAATQLRTLDLAADAFFLDGFAPARNPELWSPELCRALARLAAPGATLATWSVAAGVREALAGAEFAVEKCAGFAGKREMLRGHFRSRRPPRHAPPAERRALVLGAGLAGSTTAYALAAAGWQVTVLEAAERPATGASGNLAGVLRPLPSADDNRLSRLTRAGFLATRSLLADLPGVRWSPCGVVHLGREPIHEAQQRRAVEFLGWPPELLQYVDSASAGRLIGHPVTTGGWWFPGGGWVQPSSLCDAALAAFPERIDLRCGQAVDRLERDPSAWRAVSADGTTLATAPVVVIATGAAAPRLSQLAWLPQRAARGQVSHLPATATSDLKVVVCKLGYVAPAVDGFLPAGATLQTGDDDPAVRAADHAENLARLNLMLPGFAAPSDPEFLSGRTGFRPMSPDRLPIVGAVPDASFGTASARLPALPRLPGLWCMQGFGARGIVWSALMADFLVSCIEGEPSPLERDLADAVDPGRFLLKPRRAVAGSAGDDPDAPVAVDAC